MLFCVCPFPSIDQCVFFPILSFRIPLTETVCALSFDQSMYSLSLADSLLLSFSMLTNVYSPHLCICAAYQYVGLTVLGSLDVLIQ